jgi:hypothetical protein
LQIFVNYGFAVIEVKNNYLTMIKQSVITLTTILNVKKVTLTKIYLLLLFFLVFCNNSKAQRWKVYSRKKDPISYNNMYSKIQNSSNYDKQNMLFKPQERFIQHIPFTIDLKKFYKEYKYSIFFSSFAGFFGAGNEAAQDHYSEFSDRLQRLGIHINEAWWNNCISWKNKYKDNIPGNGEKWYTSTWATVALTDWRHFSRSLEHINLILSGLTLKIPIQQENGNVSIYKKKNDNDEIRIRKSRLLFNMFGEAGKGVVNYLIELGILYLCNRVVFQTTYSSLTGTPL